MKALVVLLAIVSFAWGGAWAADPQKVIVLPAKPGDVSFEHQKHINMKNSCAPCHATDQGGKIEGFGKDMAHNICKGCHTEGNKGPTKCGDCHHK
jgi:cytochrome c553